MTFDLGVYWNEIAAKAGLSEDQISQVGTVLGDEAVAKAIGSGFVPRPEVDKALDARTKETRESALAEAKKGYDDWYYKEALPTVKALQDEVKGLKEGKDPLDLNTNKVIPDADPDAILKKVMSDVGDLLKDRDAAVANLWEDGLSISNQWHRQFPDEDLPVKEIREFAEKNNLRPADAFEKFIAPRLTKMSDERHEKALIAAKEEGAKEALSKHHLPNDPTPKEASPFFTKPTFDGDGKREAPLSDGAKRDIFVEGWRREETG